MRIVPDLRYRRDRVDDQIRRRIRSSDILQLLFIALDEAGSVCTVAVQIVRAEGNDDALGLYDLYCLRHRI